MSDKIALIILLMLVYFLACFSKRLKFQDIGKFTFLDHLFMVDLAAKIRQSS